MPDQLKGLVITFFGVLCVVPDALFVRLIPADALTIAFWRLANVGLGVALFILIRQGTAPFRAVLATGWYGVVYMVGIGGSGLLFVLAVSLTSVAHVVLILAALPLFASLYSRVFLGEPISPRIVITMIAVAAGLAIIASGSKETEGATLAGDLTALSVAALFAAGLTAARCVRPLSMVPGMAMGHLIAAVCVLPLAAPLSVPPAAAPLVAAHAAFILCSSVLLAIGPRYITSAEVGLLILVESVLAPLLAWLVVGENPGSHALVGGAIVVGALAVSNLWLLRRQRLRNRQ
jgi:drug/metabolite transporter (DMT)-like permease